MCCLFNLSFLYVLFSVLLFHLQVSSSGLWDLQICGQKALAPIRFFSGIEHDLNTVIFKLDIVMY